MKVSRQCRTSIFSAFALHAALAVVLGSSLVACSGSTEPTRDVAAIVGNWTLAAISGQELPFTVAGAGGGFGAPTLITRGSLSFATGTGLDSVVYGVGNQSQTDTVRFSFSQRADTVLIARPPFVDTGLVIAGSPAQLTVRRNFRTGAGGFPSGRVEAFYIRPNTAAAERAMPGPKHRVP
jgi:hypothetical protein